MRDGPELLDAGTVGGWSYMGRANTIPLRSRPRTGMAPVGVQERTGVVFLGVLLEVSASMSLLIVEGVSGELLL